MLRIYWITVELWLYYNIFPHLHIHVSHRAPKSSIHQGNCELLVQKSFHTFRSVVFTLHFSTVDNQKDVFKSATSSLFDLHPPTQRSWNGYKIVPWGALVVRLEWAFRLGSMVLCLCNCAFKRVEAAEWEDHCMAVPRPQYSVWQKVEWEG